MLLHACDTALENSYYGLIYETTTLWVALPKDYSNVVIEVHPQLQITYIYTLNQGLQLYG